MSKHAWPQIGSGLYEYAFVPVPKSAKKSNVGLFFVLTGYTSALSCLLLGAKLGVAMPFWSAVGACALGDLFLIFIGSFLGGISAQSGWSTTFFARQVMGKTPSFIFSCLIIFCAVFWVGLNG
ncbi:MAG: thiamine permease, partial [Oscillospiraceae bacterium]